MSEWHSVPFDDEGITISSAFTQRLGLAKALILDHIFFTFIHHYDSPAVFRGPHPERPDEAPRTWVFFTLANFRRHIPLALSSIRDHLKELREEGWIETFREDGKCTYYRPNLERFLNSTHYRAKARRCSREPDLPRDPAPKSSPLTYPAVPDASAPPEAPLPDSGTPPCRNPAQPPAGIRQSLPTLREPSKEPFKSEPRAPASARPDGKGEEAGNVEAPSVDPAIERARQRESLILCLLEGSSALLIRRRAEAWGFAHEELVEEARCRAGISGSGGPLRVSIGNPRATRPTPCSEPERAPMPPRQEGAA